MTSEAAGRLVCLYPQSWRTRYGREFAALLEEHPCSLNTVANVLWSAGKAHMRSAISHERTRGIIVGWVWTAWIIAVVAGLVLYGMVDDSQLVVVMEHSSIFVASWRIIQVGCAVTAAAITAAALPLMWSCGVYAVRERRRDIYLRLAVPFLSAFVLVLWAASMLILTGGHWAASPWAVAFSRPDWPSDSVRWITGSISAVLLLLAAIASAASISQILRHGQFPDLRIPLFRAKVQMNPLALAAALAPWATAGIVVMLIGVALWGYMAVHLSTAVFHSAGGLLGLSGLDSWILSTALFAFAAAISARAVWHNRTPSAEG